MTLLKCLEGLGNFMLMAWHWECNLRSFHPPLFISSHLRRSPQVLLSGSLLVDCGRLDFHFLVYKRRSVRQHCYVTLHRHWCCCSHTWGQLVLLTRIGGCKLEAALALCTSPAQFNRHTAQAQSTKRRGRRREEGGTSKTYLHLLRYVVANNIIYDLKIICLCLDT